MVPKKRIKNIKLLIIMMLTAIVMNNSTLIEKEKKFLVKKIITESPKKEIKILANNKKNLKSLINV